MSKKIFKITCDYRTFDDVKARFEGKIIVDENGEMLGYSSAMRDSLVQDGTIYDTGVYKWQNSMYGIMDIHNNFRLAADFVLICIGESGSILRFKAINTPIGYRSTYEYLEHAYPYKEGPEWYFVEQSEALLQLKELNYSEKQERLIKNESLITRKYNAPHLYGFTTDAEERISAADDIYNAMPEVEEIRESNASTQVIEDSPDD